MRIFYLHYNITYSDWIYKDYILKLSTRNKILIIFFYLANDCIYNNFLNIWTLNAILL